MVYSVVLWTHLPSRNFFPPLASNRASPKTKNILTTKITMYQRLSEHTRMLPVIPVDAHVILQSKGPADAGQSVLMNIAGFQFYSARRRRHKLTNGLAD